MRIVITIFYLFLILVGVSFAVLNATSVHINLYVTTLKLPVSILMTLMLGAGLLLGFFLSLCKYWHIKTENRHIRNQLKMTEKEIKNLRAIPLKDQH